MSNLSPPSASWECWKPDNDSIDYEWLQIDLHTPITLQKIGIQSSTNSSGWVTYYNVSYLTSDNQMDWMDYEESGQTVVSD